MTARVKVEVNGNYEVPVAIRDLNAETTTSVVSGVGHDGPREQVFPLYEGRTIEVGPERAAEQAPQTNETAQPDQTASER